MIQEATTGKMNHKTSVIKFDYVLKIIMSLLKELKITAANVLNIRMKLYVLQFFFSILLSLNKPSYDQNCLRRLNLVV